MTIRGLQHLLTLWADVDAKSLKIRVTRAKHALQRTNTQRFAHIQVFRREREIEREAPMDKWWFSVYDFTKFCAMRIPEALMPTRYFHMALSIKLMLCQIVTTSNAPAQDKEQHTA